MFKKLFPFQSILGEKKEITVINRSSGESFQEVVLGEDAMRMVYGNSFSINLADKFLTNKVLSDVYGAYNDSSLSRRKIETFVSDLNLDISECEKDVTEYSSFNEFFARKLRADTRPIHKNKSGFISPGDGRLLVFPKIDETTIAYVKWAPISLFELFGKDRNLSDKFKNGSCGVLRLCPADYHRVHFPVSGKAGASKVIQGQLHSVSPYALEKKIPVYCLNKRTICEIETKNQGTILMMEIGALFVGSIVQTYRAGMNVEKGLEKGFFKFGGSTSIFFAEEGGLKFDEDLIQNSHNNLETYVKMGEKIGELS
jgi:phosphatidylserine decarboxylase